MFRLFFFLKLLAKTFRKTKNFQKKKFYRIKEKMIFMNNMKLCSELWSNYIKCMTQKINVKITKCNELHDIWHKCYYSTSYILRHSSRR